MTVITAEPSGCAGASRLKRSMCPTSANDGSMTLEVTFDIGSDPDLDAIFMVDQDPDLNSYAECVGDNIVVR